MAKNYTRPLAEVYQLLEVTRQATGDHLSACIVGPTYDLYRYGIEKDVTGYTYATGVDAKYDYTTESGATYKLDENSVKVYGDDLQKSILTSSIDSTTLTWSIDSSNSRKLRMGKPSDTNIETKANTAFEEISIGDCAWIKGNLPPATEEAGWQRCVIIDKDSVNKTITVDVPFAYTDSTTNCFITRPVSGYIPEIDEDSGSVNWTKDSDSVQMSSGLAVDGKTLVSGLGTIYPEFRVLHYPNDVDTEDIVEITTVDDIQSNFGTIDIGNDLAYGCYCALRGSAGRPIYAIRTGGIDVDAFTAAMKKTEFDSSVYSFAPLTEDSAVADKVVEFNAGMSEPDVKMWRRTLIGVDAPGEYVLTDKDNEGKTLKLTASMPNNQSHESYYPVTFTVPTGTQFDLRAIALEGSYVALHPGDIVRVTIANTIYDCIATAVSSTTVETMCKTSTGVITSQDQPIAVELVKRDSVANTIEYVGTTAKKYSSRRASVVFCDGGTTIEDDRVVVVPNRFLAAEIAGISSAVVPQQSITHTVIQGINKASNMYSRYTTAQLDDIASQGVLIITQDTKGTDCYIRHQLTTEMDKGNLYFEESCTRNLDNISYALADIVNKYIGRANVTTAALRAIKIDITAALTEFTQNSTDDMVGPSLVDWDNLEVYQDPKFKDRVIINVNLYLPLPLNNIKLFAMAYVATVSI